MKTLLIILLLAAAAQANIQGFCPVESFHDGLYFVVPVLTMTISNELMRKTIKRKRIGYIALTGIGTLFVQNLYYNRRKEKRYLRRYAAFVGVPIGFVINF